MTVLPIARMIAPNKEIDSEAHRKAAKATLASLQQVVSYQELTRVSNRPPAEVEALQKEVADIIPAGNIVALVTSGLLRLRGRTISTNQAQSDVSALLRSMEMLPRNIAIYGTFFAAPAFVLSAYQKLLTLTGKDPDSAFPDGLWQFYLEFALREDSAHHTNETLGFQSALARYGLQTSSADQLAAWVCAVSQIYFQYDDMLENEWREQVFLAILQQHITDLNLGDKLYFQRLPQAWANQRPYWRGHDATADENYATYRHRRFDNFIRSRLKFLPEAERDNVTNSYNERAKTELADYQSQMTILATLSPERYRESRIPIPLWLARIGVIFQGRYFLIPACRTDPNGYPLLFQNMSPDAPFDVLPPNVKGELCDLKGQPLRVERNGKVYDQNDRLRGYLRPVHFETVRQHVAYIFDQTHLDSLPQAVLDEQLLTIRRTEQERVRKQFDSTDLEQELSALKSAPILINWDMQEVTKPLSYIRRGKRGIGDHAVTIFHTPTSTVFDESHIFFDGVGGLAFSEVITGEAVSWAAYFNNFGTVEPSSEGLFFLKLEAQPGLEKFPQTKTVEVSAESTNVNMKSLAFLRKSLPQRHPNLNLTVNDLLILYRYKFGREYHYSSRVEDALVKFQDKYTPQINEVYNLTKEALAKLQTSHPSILIPLDAAGISPRERLYPTTFRNPFTEIWTIYESTSKTLNRYSSNQNQTNWAEFSDNRRSLLSQLNYFGELLRAYKRVALQGGSISTATMKLLAHLPDSLRKILDTIPQRIDVLNEVLKGEEVISNVGRVSKGASITRFISAKDDNENKTLVWGILTDDSDVLHISLRDFRPHVAALASLNRLDLAQIIVADCVESFADGFNQFVARLLDIANTNSTYVQEARE